MSDILAKENRVTALCVSRDFDLWCITTPATHHQWTWIRGYEAKPYPLMWHPFLPLDTPLPPYWLMCHPSPPTGTPPPLHSMRSWHATPPPQDSEWHGLHFMTKLHPRGALLDGLFHQFLAPEMVTGPVSKSGGMCGQTCRCLFDPETNPWTVRTL